MSKSYERKCERGRKRKGLFFFPFRLGGHSSQPPGFKGNVAPLNLNKF